MRQGWLACAAMAAFTGLAGCETPPEMVAGTAPAAVTPADQALAEAGVRSFLRDPESAQFQNLHGYATSQGDRIICGEYNAKNGFGGYAGFASFYTRLRGEAVANAQIDFMADAACNEAASGRIIINPPYK